MRRAKKNNGSNTNAFAEAVRQSGLDFDDAVMAETRVEAEAESRQAAQYRAERSGTAAQTGVDKAALRNYVGKKTVANAVGRAVRAMKDMNTIIGEGFTETEIASLTKAAEEQEKSHYRTELLQQLIHETHSILPTKQVLRKSLKSTK